MWNMQENKSHLFRVGEEQEESETKETSLHQ